MIKANAKINTLQYDRFSKKLRQVLPKTIRKNLSRISIFTIREIKKRTMRGVDVRLSRFRPYAPTTGVGRKENRGTVDLFDTGQMQNSMNFMLKGNFRSQLGFRNATANKKAYYHDIEGVGKNKIRREFFGIDKKTEEF